MSGDYTGTPDAHLVYIMYPLGLLFKFLYTVAPKVSWYEVFTVSVHLACLVILSGLGLSLFDANKSNAEKGVNGSGAGGYSILQKVLGCLGIFTLLAGVDLPFLFVSQYTATAGLLAATAVACLLGKNDIPAAVLFVLSLWLRKQVFFMALPVALAAFAVRLFGEKRRISKESAAAGKTNYRKGLNKRKITGRIITLAAALAITGASFIADGIAYSSPQWKAFKAFDAQRRRVYDYGLLPEYAGNEAFFDKLGINTDEYTALVEYDLDAVDGLNTDIVKEIADRQQAVLDEWKQYYNVFNKTVRDTALNIAGNIKTLHGVLAIIIMVVSTVVLFIRMIGKKEILPFAGMLLTGIYYFSFTALFSYLGRLPERVMFGLDMLLIAFGLFGMLNSFKDVKGKAAYAMPVILAAVAVPVIIISIRQTGVLLKDASARTEEYDEVMQTVGRNSDAVFFIDTNVFENAAGIMTEFMDEEYLYEPAGAFKMADWLYGSPLREQRKERLGVKSLFENEFEGKRFVIIPRDKSSDWLGSILGGYGLSIKEAGCVSGNNIYSLVPQNDSR